MLNPTSSGREAVRKLIAHVRRDFPGAENGAISADRAGYCRARARIPLGVIVDMTVNRARPSHRPDSMRPEQFELLPRSIPVRIIRYTHSRRGFRTLSVTLVTTVLDPGIAAAEFAELYFRRWGIELHFRELKTFLKMDVLRSLTPAMIEREVRTHFVAYNLIRCVMQTAALTHHIELRRVSFNPKTEVGEKKVFKSRGTPPHVADRNPTSAKSGFSIPKRSR